LIGRNHKNNKSTFNKCGPGSAFVKSGLESALIKCGLNFFFYRSEFKSWIEYKYEYEYEYE
jgi:hypothetical protein